MLPSDQVPFCSGVKHNYKHTCNVTERKIPRHLVRIVLRLKYSERRYDQFFQMDGQYCWNAILHIHATCKLLGSPIAFSRKFLLRHTQSKRRMEGRLYFPLKNWKSFFFWIVLSFLIVAASKPFWKHVLYTWKSNKTAFSYWRVNIKQMDSLLCSTHIKNK